MKFGNASWGFRETPLEEQLRITHKMGLSILELGIANAPLDLPLDITDTEIEDVVRLYKKYETELLCAATGNDFTTGNTNDVFKVKKVIEICSKLGIKYLRIFSGFSSVEDVVGERWDNMIKCINEVAEFAMIKGVTLTIETHGGVNSFEDGVRHFDSTSSNPETLLKMLGEIPEQVMINFDPANLWAVGIKAPNELYEKIKDRVAVAHFKDFVTLDNGNIKPAACGESDMDWSAILKAMNDFKGPVLFEYENTDDIEAGSLRCYNYIKRLKENLL